MIPASPTAPETAAATALVPRATSVPVVAVAAVLAALVAAGVSWPHTATTRALVLAWVVWAGAMTWGITRRPVSVAFLGVQAWWALGVLLGATFATFDGYAEIGPARFRDGIAGAIVLATVAEAGIWLGAALVHLWRRPPVADPRARPAIVRVPVTVAPGRLDRWAVVFLVAGAASLVLYIRLAGADLATLNVLTGSATYGDLARSADGTVVKYLKTLAALAGISLVIVALRAGRSARSWLSPVLVTLAAAALLSASGGRSWLAVPAVAALLVWMKVAPHRVARRPGTLLLLGGLGLLVLATLIGGLRGQADTKEVDVEAFVAKEAHGGVFAPTVGLVETVPHQHDRLGGASYAEVLALPVPRAMWPDKPTNVLTALQVDIIGKDIGASFGFHGELYANLGWWGVIVGTTAFGILLETAWLAFVRARRVANAVVLAATLAVLAQVATRDYVAGQLAGQFGFIVGMLLLARLVGAADGVARSSRPSRTPMAAA